MSEIVKEDFSEVLKQIQLSKQKAYKQVNTVLIDLYWNIGSLISEKTLSQNWGKSVVKELADYIKLQDGTVNQTV